jgi:hypothetical protein
VGRKRMMQRKNEENRYETGGKYERKGKHERPFCIPQSLLERAHLNWH